MNSARWSRVGPAFVLLALFCIWTLLTSSGQLAFLDRLGTFTPPAALSPAGQILGAIALLTYPGVLYIVLVALAVWAFRRRLRRLALASLGTLLASWWLSEGVKFLVARPRPDHAVPLLTTMGWSYPSGHVTSATAIATMAIVAAAATHQPRYLRRRVAIGSIAGVVIIAANRLALQAHHVTDLVAGVLLGMFAATVVLAISGVHPVFLPRRGVPNRGRAAVIVNPAKVGDWQTLRRAVQHEADQAGWRVLWLETEPDEGVEGLVASAMRAKAKLVVVGGGDGTVREVSSALAGTDVGFAILPLGTGNLLARNLGIPLDIGDAAHVAFGTRSRTIDLVELTADDNPPVHFAVMAGIGIDAALMNATNADLKRMMGPAAYFFAAPQVLTSEPFTCRIAMDDGQAVSTKASIALVGNVGSVMGQIQVLPDALPDDGVLDLVVASPRSITDWARIAGRVISGSDDPAELARATGSSVTIEVSGDPVEYQLDGDTIGSCNTLSARVVPSALRVSVPSQVADPAPPGDPSDGHHSSPDA